STCPRCASCRPSARGSCCRPATRPSPPGGCSPTRRTWLRGRPGRSPSPCTGSPAPATPAGPRRQARSPGGGVRDRRGRHRPPPRAAVLPPPPHPLPPPPPPAPPPPPRGGAPPLPFPPPPLQDWLWHAHGVRSASFQPLIFSGVILLHTPYILGSVA